MNIRSKNDNEIVFASKGDLIKFLERVNSGNPILLEFEKDGNMETVYVTQSIIPEINDNKIRLSSIETKGV